MKLKLFRFVFWGFVGILSFLLIVGIGITASTLLEARIPISSIISGDFTPEQDRKIEEIMERKADTIAPKIVNFLIPDFKYSEFFEKADLIYEPTEWAPYTEEEIQESINKGGQMQEDAFNKALDDAINFDNTTLKDARDQGIKNAGGID